MARGEKVILGAGVVVTRCGAWLKVRASRTIAVATNAPPDATAATHRETMPMAHRRARASRPGQCQMEADLRLSETTSSTDSYSGGIRGSTGITGYGASRR